MVNFNHFGCDRRAPQAAHWCICAISRGIASAYAGNCTVLAPGPVPLLRVSLDQSTSPHGNGIADSASLLSLGRDSAAARPRPRLTLLGCDSGGSDGLGDFAVRASTGANVSSVPVAISYFSEGSISAASASIPLGSDGTGTTDLRDDASGVTVTLIQVGAGFTVTLQLLSDGEVVDEATGATADVSVSAGDTDADFDF